MSSNSRFPHQPVFKPKGRRVTYLQVDALFDFLIAHQELTTGYSNSTAGRYRNQKSWEAAANILNRISGGARKDAKAWSAFWSNYKNKLKRRVQFVRAARKNGQEHSTKLTELDIKVLPILGPSFGCGGSPNDSEENDTKNEFTTVKCSRAGSGASPPPSSPDTLPSPPSPSAPRATPGPPAPPRAAAHAQGTATRPKRRRPARRPSPAPNGAATDGSSSDQDHGPALRRLYRQTEDKTSAALLRVAGAIETLAEAAQAQAAAARATAEGMEMIARAVTEVLSKRHVTREDEINTYMQ